MSFVVNKDMTRNFQIDASTILAGGRRHFFGLGPTIGPEQDHGFQSGRLLLRPREGNACLSSRSSTQNRVLDI
jgi:hypothetical protein